ILSGERLPALRHLGLQDSEIQDEIPAAVASAPSLARLESLALSMGALSDEGAEALLSGQPLTHLKRLDLHHHYLTDPMVDRVRAALPGVEVDLSEQEEPDDDEWRYVAVSE
ncbi:leucine-rich repeat domain-containing protein, partial [Streptosporangium algeriense]